MWCTTNTWHLTVWHFQPFVFLFEHKLIYDRRLFSLCISLTLGSTIRDSPPWTMSVRYSPVEICCCPPSIDTRLLSCFCLPTLSRRRFATDKSTKIRQHSMIFRAWEFAIVSRRFDGIFPDTKSRCDMSTAARQLRNRFRTQNVRIGFSHFVVLRSRPV